MGFAYEDAYENLRLPNLALRIARGDVKLPLPDIEVPFGDYGFPPALIPLFSRGAGPEYYGFWKHWFCDRELTVVRIDVANGYRATEVARDLDQLLILLLLEAVVVNDGVTSRIRAFADECGLEQLDEIDEVSLESGDDPRGLLRIDTFAARTPAALVDRHAKYNGDYPVAPEVLPDDRLRFVCSFELPPEAWLKTARRNSAPPWLSRTDQQKVFEGCLDVGDVSGAWMSLNSTRWRFADAKKSIAVLADVAENEEFSRVAAAWRSRGHEWVEEY